MKKYITHGVALTIFLGIFLYSQLFIADEMSYWDFLTYEYVLNIGVVGLGIIIGYGIKNYYIILAGATFTLLIYCLVFIFDSKELFTAFFLAIYTVFLGFATLANLSRHFKDWVLARDSFS
jgi:ABC-type multidrug transport system permease subunit